MESYSEECNELKQSYATCFKIWLRDEYLPLSEQENATQKILTKFGSGFVPCKELFEPYNKCLMNALNRDGVDLVKVEQDLIRQPLETGLDDKTKK